MMTKKVVWTGKVATVRERAGAAKGLRRWAEHVLQQATVIVPLAPSGGTLQDSGATDVDAGRLEASVSYDTPYACIQHENMTYHHAPGRQAKYLEQPLNASRLTGLEILAEEIRLSLEG